MMVAKQTGAPRRVTLVSAFAAVYVIWGSTYLAIRFAIETLPPFLMAGVRFVIAGGILYAVARALGAGRPERLHWRSAAIIGGLLLLGGNGGVVWAEQTVPAPPAAHTSSPVRSHAPCPAVQAAPTSKPSSTAPSQLLSMPSQTSVLPG